MGQGSGVRGFQSQGTEHVVFGVTLKPRVE